MDSPIQLFIVFFLAGILLLGLEVIVPGGVLGFIGGLLLLAAMVTSFTAFGALGGLISSVLIIVLAGVILLIWVEIFPRTAIGKMLTLSKDAKSFRSTPERYKELLNKEGVTKTSLHPAGLVTIEGERVDVVAEGGWIDPGTRIRVIEVEGNRIAVREIKDA